MSIIHMQTESVYELVSRLNQYSAHIANISDDLRNASFRLDVHWTGGKGDYYGSRLRNSARRMNDLNSQVQSLRIRTGNEVEEWEQTAANLHDPITLGTIINNIFDDGLDDLNWAWGVTLPLLFTAPFLKSGGEMLKKLLDKGSGDYLDKILKKSPFNKTHFTSWGESIGRGLNNFFHTRGFVGDVGGIFGKLGNFIKVNFKAVSQGVVTGAFDIFEGFTDNEGAAKAILTGVITGGIVIGACIACPALIPVLAYLGAAQIAGIGLSAFLESCGLSSESIAINNITEGLDLTGYVSDIADGLYDLVNLPSGNQDPRLFGEFVDRFTGLWEGLVFPYAQSGDVVATMI